MRPLCQRYPLGSATWHHHNRSKLTGSHSRQPTVILTTPTRAVCPPTGTPRAPPCIPEKPRPDPRGNPLGGGRAVPVGCWRPVEGSGQQDGHALDGEGDPEGVGQAGRPQAPLPRVRLGGGGVRGVAWAAVQPHRSRDGMEHWTGRGPVPETDSPAKGTK